MQDACISVNMLSQWQVCLPGILVELVSVLSNTLPAHFSFISEYIGLLKNYL